MIKFIIGSIVGLIVGGNIGVILMALLKINPKTCSICHEKDADICQDCYIKLHIDNDELRQENYFLHLKHDNNEQFSNFMKENENHIPMIN